ncbi:MAG: fatty acid desaturase [Pseudomonadota bacterium]
MGETMRETRRAAVEWPTLALLVACYGLWALAVFWLSTIWLPLGIAVTALALAQHSSLTHEALHGHPFRNPYLNEATVFPALGLGVPYRRFRDLHLAHHVDSVLTDPYDDPETNYLDPQVWHRLPRVVQYILMLNNTLAGRMVFGPALGQIAMMEEDLRLIRNGDRDVALAWGLHLAGIVPVIGLVVVSPMPIWAYLVAAYAAFSIVKIRTFLEHQAHERASGRTVVIEDRGPLALIFLNNNLHAVHHMHPSVPWYRLPGLFRRNREKYLGRNGHYYYRSYRDIFARHFFRAKDPVPHPIYQPVREPAE